MLAVPCEGRAWEFCFLGRFLPGFGMSQTRKWQYLLGAVAGPSSLAQALPLLVPGGRIPAHGVGLSDTEASIPARPPKTRGAGAEGVTRLEIKTRVCLGTCSFDVHTAP